MRGVINCPAGLGDILFCQPVFLHLFRRYPNMESWTWPVNEVYKDIVEYWNLNGRLKENYKLTFTTIPADEAARNYERACMGMTYSPEAFNQEIWFHVIGADSRDYGRTDGNVMFPKWQEYAISEESDWRDSFFLPIDTETLEGNPVVAALQNLYSEDILDKPFGLFNNYYGTPPNQQTQPEVTMALDDSVNWLRMDFFPGTTLWDWVPVIAKCSKIYTVETSVCYLADVLCGDVEMKQFQKKQPHEMLDGFKWARGVYHHPNWEFVNDPLNQ